MPQQPFWPFPSRGPSEAELRQKQEAEDAKLLPSMVAELTAMKLGKAETGVATSTGTTTSATQQMTAAKPARRPGQ